MLTYRTPGVYFEQVERRQPVSPLRTDIAGFVGYAARGPLFVPVRLTDARRFAAVFGEPLPYAHLGHAVDGFFQNGGAICYVVRVADGEVAHAAGTTIDGADGAPVLRLWASHGTVLDPATGEPRTDGERPVRYPSPGAWGNRLAVGIETASLGSTRTRGDQPATGASSRVAGLSGFGRGSVVQVRLTEASAAIYRRVVDIDPQQGESVWDEPLATAYIAPACGLQLATLEYSLLVYLDGQVEERHPNLSPVAEHDRYVVRVLQRESRLIDAEIPASAATSDWRNPLRWPLATPRIGLAGGRDGLATVEKDDHIRALDELALVDDVSILAAPDVVLRAAPPATASRAPTATDPCRVLAPPPAGRVAGLVKDASTDTPIAGVRVESLGGSGRSTATDRNGLFTLTGLDPVQESLLLTREGYAETETLVTPSIRPVTEPASFLLDPVTLPRPLHLDDIFDVHQAMLRQGERGLYRVAILDPPGEMLAFEDIQTWRSRFDSRYGAMYYPWLLIDAGGGAGLRAVPPSGLVAGLIARTDLQQGVHRAPANAALNGVKAVTAEVDDAAQAVLNPLGINCIRAFPGRGIRVFGARTIGSDPDYRYLNVRRLLLMIEEAVEDSTQWAVFEPISSVLRQTLVFTLNSFLEGLWRGGALSGSSRDEAFRVSADEALSPPGAIDAGQLIAEIAVAPTHPLEFIRFRLGRTDEAITIRE